MNELFKLYEENLTSNTKIAFPRTDSKYEDVRMCR